MKTKVLLYEDNKELRESLMAYIRFSENLEFLVAFENCEKVEKHLKTYQPDIVLMDIDMPIMNGIEGLKIIRKIDPEIPVLMLTVFEDNEHIVSARQEGATGYLLKQHITTRLETAIQEAMEGGAPMSPVVARLLLNHISQKKEQTESYALTLREREILQSLTLGNSVKMIAAQLGISNGTVSSHIKNIYEKLCVHSQAEAVGKALKEQIEKSKTFLEERSADLHQKKDETRMSIDTFY